MRSTEEIRALLEKLDGKRASELEDETLEFKGWEANVKQLHRLLREEAVCLANAHGGTIVLGVRDNVRTKKEAIQGGGVYDIPGLRRAIYDGTDPHILTDIEELVEQEQTMLLIHIPKGLPPHTTSDGVSKIRVGAECKPLTGRMLAQLLASGGECDFTAEIVTEADIESLHPTDVAALRGIIT